MVGQLSEPSGFAHAHTVSDASQESAECKAHQFVEPSDSALHWKVLSQQKARWMRQIFYLKLALKRKKQKEWTKSPAEAACLLNLHKLIMLSGRLWQITLKTKMKRSFQKEIEKILQPKISVRCLLTRKSNHYLFLPDRGTQPSWTDTCPWRKHRD